MNKRKYNKCVKMLDKVLILLQEEEVNYKKEKYAEIKITVYKALKGLKQNKCFWITGR